jgi:hypothetical protein
MFRHYIGVLCARIIVKLAQSAYIVQDYKSTTVKSPEVDILDVPVTCELCALSYTMAWSHTLFLRSMLCRDTRR